MHAAIIARAERYFEFAALGTTWRTEILAGVTTFMTMAYIIFVNPSILTRGRDADRGRDRGDVPRGGSRQPADGRVRPLSIALAPGMGLNAYFTYSVVKGMGVDWHTALGAVFFPAWRFCFSLRWAFAR